MLTYKSNGSTVGDGTRITRISTDASGDQHFAVMVDEKTERFSEVVGCIGDGHVPVDPPIDPEPPVDPGPELPTDPETPPIIPPDPEPPVDPNPPSTGAWHDAVWATRHGAGIGADKKAKIPARQWAVNVGLPVKGTVLTVNRSNVKDRDIDFSGLSVNWRGDHANLTNCLFDVAASPGNRTIGLFSRSATLSDCRFDNSKTKRNQVMVKFDGVAGDNCVIRRGYFVQPSTDAVKGPKGGTLTMEDFAIDGVYVGAGAHLDPIDMRGAAQGSVLRRFVILGNYSGLPPSKKEGFNNLIRCADGYRPNGHTYERGIFVGSSHVLTKSILLSPAKSSSTGIDFKECLIDMREHNTLINAAAKINIWDVHEFDAATGAVGQRIHIPNAAIIPAGG